MLIAVRHKTVYRYEVEARYAIQALRLTPRSFEGQRVHNWRIEAPGFDKAASFVDGFGNITHLTTLRAPHTGLSIEAAGLIETENKAGILKGVKEAAPVRVYLRRTPATEPSEAITALAQSCRKSSVLDTLHQLMGTIHETIRYEIGTTHAQSTAKDVLEARSGVCQDHAHVFISAARELTIPARYINGYFVTGGDGSAEAHHAWAEAWVDSLGWVGFDAANNTCPTERYIRLAAGLDARMAAPIRGLQRGGEQEALDVVVEVQQQQEQGGQQQ